jgi:hypothetical protein
VGAGIAQSVSRLATGWKVQGGARFSAPAPGPTQPPVQWVPGLSARERRPGRDAAHPPPPSSAEVKKELSYTSTHPMGPPGPVTGFPLPFTKRLS